MLCSFRTTGLPPPAPPSSSWARPAMRLSSCLTFFRLRSPCLGVPLCALLGFAGPALRDTWLFCPCLERSVSEGSSLGLRDLHGQWDELASRLQAAHDRSTGQAAKRSRGGRHVQQPFLVRNGTQDAVDVQPHTV